MGSRQVAAAAGQPNFPNRTLCQGDNLPFLRSMDSETVDLIATDPPFNKSRDFHATPDSLAAGAKFHDRWKWDDARTEWIDKIKDDFPKVWNVINGSRESYGDDMGGFLCFIGVRLLEMHRVLRDTGSIYLHCDPTASHYLKELMDAVFGRKNFRNEIIWCYAGGGIPKKDFPRKHDVIFRYAKSTDYRFNPQMRNYSATGSGIHSDGTRYDKEKDKTPHNDWWVDIAGVNAMSKEKRGYPTQKPLALYERIIKASSNPGDVVLDPFCGCATTCVAAERLQRRWIGIDLWPGAYGITEDRMKKEGLLATISDPRPDLLVAAGTITKRTDPFTRTDDGLEAVPFLPRRLTQYGDRERDPHTNAEKKQILLERHGSRCQGCGNNLREYYLQLDHKEPRAAGGSNLLRNRVLLCGPCNMAKSHRLTLAGLREWLEKNGRMINRKNLIPLRDL